MFAKSVAILNSIFSGNGLYLPFMPKSRLFKGVQLFLLINTIIANLICALVIIKTTSGFFTVFAWTSYYIYSIVHCLVFYSKRYQIVVLIREIASHLKNSQLLRLRQVSIKLMICFIIVLLHYITSQVLEWFIGEGFAALSVKLLNVPQSSPYYTYICVFVTFYYHVLTAPFYHWYTQSFALFIWILVAVYYVEYNYFEFLVSSTTRDANFFKTQFLKRQAISKLKSNIDDTLNVFPLLWFAYLFFALVGWTLYARNLFIGIEIVKTVILMYTSFEMVIWTIMIFMVPLAISKLNRLVSSMADAAITNIVATDCGDNLQKALLINELKTNADIKRSAQTLFYINNEFLLGFIGAIVSFSVLFAQLSQ